MTAFETEEIIEEHIGEEGMPTFNHSNICAEISGQIWDDKRFKPLPELTLDVGKGLTPDICIYLRENVKPDYWRDISRYMEMPLLAIEVVSPSQSVQTLVEKAEVLLENGVKTVWVVEPVTRSIVVSTKNGKQVFQNQEIESEGVKVDFRKIFGDG